ncbi:MOSC domain-containing protein [Zobellia laminariae]|uniref:MOSC domain-containing protein n=1 Tax=Zobellia laminariae TaxID=248906 RepID=UPI0026F40B59|nr:MOSC domain-containing protein [Zobellia laminariae]WKX75303.1 MOSC domain-containing protein [Zobellia laminariae]
MKSKYNGKENDFISFSDISPIHLISEESLNDLNSKLESPVTIQNFRPNIVVSGCAAYEEDNWSSITIGDCEFEVTLKTPISVNLPQLTQSQHKFIVNKNH